MEGIITQNCAHLNEGHVNILCAYKADGVNFALKIQASRYRNAVPAAPLRPFEYQSPATLPLARADAVYRPCPDIAYPAGAIQTNPPAGSLHDSKCTPNTGIVVVLRRTSRTPGLARLQRRPRLLKPVSYSCHNADFPGCEHTG